MYPLISLSNPPPLGPSSDIDFCPGKILLIVANIQIIEQLFE